MDSAQGNPQFFLKREDGTIVPLIAISGLQPTSVAPPVSSFRLPYHAANSRADGLFEPRCPQFVLEAAALGHAAESSTASLPPQEPGLEASKSSFFDCRSVRSAYAGRPVKSFGIQEHAPVMLPQSPPVRQPIGPPTTPVLLPAAEPSPSVPVATPVAARTPKRSPSSAPASKPAASQPSPPWHRFSAMSLKPAPGVKEYCSYWLRHGECDYAQQGCLYKHEMPSDPATLARIGLRDIPRWYREKHGLGSYLAVSGAKGGMSLAERCKRKDKEEMMMGRNWRSYGRRGSAAARKRGGLLVPIPRSSSAASSSSCQRDGHNTDTAPGVSERDKQLHKTLAELREWEAAEKKRRAAAGGKYAVSDNGHDDHTDTDGVVHVRSEPKQQPDSTIEISSRSSVAAPSATEAATAAAGVRRASSTSSSDEGDGRNGRSTPARLTRRHRLAAAARGGKAAAATVSPSAFPRAGAAGAGAGAPRVSRKLPYRGWITSTTGSRSLVTATATAASSSSAAASVAAEAAEESKTAKRKQRRRAVSPGRLSVVSDSEFDVMDGGDDQGSRTGEISGSRKLSLDQYDHDD